MATVTSFTAARMLQIENSTVTGGSVNEEGHLILSTRDGTLIDAGLLGGVGGASVTTSTTPPLEPENGDMWFDTTDGQVYVFYVDVDSSQWVSISGGGGAKYPLGATVAWAGANEPSWGLFLNGQTVSASEYSGLAALFPEWVSGTDLILPDWGGHTPVGYKAGDDTFFTLGAMLGEKTHRHDFRIALFDNAWKPSGEHSAMGASHYPSADRAGAYRYSSEVYSGADESGGAAPQDSKSRTVSGSTTSTTATSVRKISTGDTDLAINIQPSVVVNWVICAASSSGDFDFEVQTALVNQVSALDSKINSRPTAVGSFAGGIVANTYMVMENMVVSGGMSFPNTTTLVVPETGLYQINASQLIDPAGAAYLECRINGNLEYHAYTMGDRLDLHIGIALNLAAGDEIRFYFRLSIDSSWPKPHSHVSVYRV